MTLLARFLVYNLLLSLAAGLVAWAIAVAALRLLGIRSSAQSLSLLGLPLVKSLFILAGLGLAFPWPAALFERWHAMALPFRQVLPFLLAWAVGINLILLIVIRQARRALLKDARPAAQAAPRLVAIFDQVAVAYQNVPCPTCSDDICCVVQQNRQVSLLVSERLDSPLALADPGAPAILFPAGLVPLLSDAELAGALAHELAHFILRRPYWCSAGTLQKISLLSPLAALVSHYLHRQEEKACDDLAVALAGQPEIYAGMLTKSFRFASQQKGKAALRRWQPLPRLLGFKPLLSERVEHILSGDARPACGKSSRAVFWLAWGLLFILLFFSWPF